MHEQTGSLREWLVPFAFVICAGWAVWHLPAYIMDFIPHENESIHQQMSELHERKDILALPGLFGGKADFLDWLALVLMPIIFAFGMRDLKHAHMEYPHWRQIDRVALFFGRITMVLIITMTCIMLYEVFLRYLFEAPTLWANELTLWIGGYVFLFSGLYAMQQRCHIRIFILYDVVPRWMQHLFDVISVVLLNIFAIFLIYGSYGQVFGIKFHRWEMFGTAFDPPIPATVQPMILIVIALIAIQATINLIADWNIEPGVHTAADDIDEDELEAIKHSLEDQK